MFDSAYGSLSPPPPFPGNDNSFWQQPMANYFPTVDASGNVLQAFGDPSLQLAMVTYASPVTYASAVMMPPLPVPPPVSFGYESGNGSFLSSTSVCAPPPPPAMDPPIMPPADVPPPPPPESADAAPPKEISTVAKSNQKTKKKNAKKIQEEDEDDDWQHCKPCDMKFSNEQEYYRHCRGMNHSQRVLEYDGRSSSDNSTPAVVEIPLSQPPPPPPEPAAEEVEDEWQHCKPCDIKFSNAPEYYRHCRGLNHSQRVLEYEGHSSTAETDSPFSKPLPLQNSSQPMPKPVVTTTKQQNVAISKPATSTSGAKPLFAPGVRAAAPVRPQTSAFGASSFQNSTPRPLMGGPPVRNQFGGIGQEDLLYASQHPSYGTQEEDYYAADGDYDDLWSEEQEFEPPSTKRTRRMETKEGQVLPVADKTPSEIGRPETDGAFYCNVCHVKSTSANGFADHLKGKRHLKTLKATKETGAQSVQVKNSAQPQQAGYLEARDTGQRAKIEDALLHVVEPLIGLSFIVEYVNYDDDGELHEPRYVCNLCECKCDPRTLISHLKGYKHRSAYMQECRSDYFAHLNQLQNNKPMQIESAAEYAMCIEQEEGRAPIRQRAEFTVAAPQKSFANPVNSPAKRLNITPQPQQQMYRPPPPQQQQMHPQNPPHQLQMRQQSPQQQQRQPNFSPFAVQSSPSLPPAPTGRDPHATPEIPKLGSGYASKNAGDQKLDSSFSSVSASPIPTVPSQPLTLSNESLQSLLLSLSTSSVQTEEDAAMALKISNALTAALIKYRMDQVMKKGSSASASSSVSISTSQLPQSSFSTFTSTPLSTYNDALTSGLSSFKNVSAPGSSLSSQLNSAAALSGHYGSTSSFNSAGLTQVYGNLSTHQSSFSDQLRDTANSSIGNYSTTSSFDRGFSNNKSTSSSLDRDFVSPASNFQDSNSYTRSESFKSSQQHIAATLSAFEASKGGYQKQREQLSSRDFDEPQSRSWMPSTDASRPRSPAFATGMASSSLSASLQFQPSSASSAYSRDSTGSLSQADETSKYFGYDSSSKLPIISSPDLVAYPRNDTLDTLPKICPSELLQKLKNICVPTLKPTQSAASTPSSTTMTSSGTPLWTNSNAPRRVLSAQEYEARKKQT